MLLKDIWPVAQFSRLSFDTTCLYVFAENKLISNVKKVSFFLEHPVHRLVQLCFTHVISDSLDTRALKGWIPKLEISLMDKPTTKRYAIGIKFSA